MRSRPADPPRAVALAVALALTLAFALVVAASAPVVSADDVSVERVSLTGPGVLDRGDRPTVAGWRRVNVTATVGTGTDAYEVCVGVGATDATPVELACRRLAGTGTAANVTASVDRLPENATGSRQVTVTVRRANEGSATGEVLARGSRGVRVLAAAGDEDDDGLENRRELDAETRYDEADTDGDGLADGPEVNTFGTDPLTTDTDGDGLDDGVEVNDEETDPTAADTDGDGLDDGVEVTTHGSDPTATDTDGDGLDDGAEVTEWQTDPTAADTDGDGLDDGPEVNVHGTDPTATDTDGDGLDDGPEVERYGTDPTAADTDGDGLDDGREVNEYGTDPTRRDTDGDGRADGAEVDEGSDPTGGESGTFGAPGLPVVVAVLVGLSLVAGAAVLVGRRGVAAPWGGADDAGGGTDDGSPPDGSTGSADGVGGVAAGSERVPPDALSDEGRVHSLVERHEGRVKQSVIVEQTGWSKSKVSRVLSEMAEEGEIEKIPIGRENLIAHPEAAPDGAASPFDDEDPTPDGSAR